MSVDRVQDLAEPGLLVPAVTADMSTRDAALALASAGFRVFPVDHPELPRCAGVGRTHDPVACTDRGKHPAVAFSKVATTDPKMIEAWWAGMPRNVGVLTGAQLVVLDEDTSGEVERFASERGVTIPSTLLVGTAKGRHYYFAARAGQELNNHEGAFGPYDINVRAGNAYVVGPGSLHASGVVYAVETAVVPAPLPDWVLDAVKDRRSVASVGPVNDGWAAVNPPRGLAAVPSVIRGPRPDGGGERHNVLINYACSLRARDVPYAEAEVLFRSVWARCEQPPAASTPLTWDDAQAKLADAYNRYPAGPSERRDHDLVAVTNLGPAPAEVAEFWSTRPALAHIQEFAYARMVAPWALLGVLMLRALAVTPPWVVLPALIGGRGSLNLFVASVGPSGAGKGAVNAAAVDAVDFVAPIYTAMVGSGEGLVHQYAHRQKGEIVYDRESVLFFVPEVDTLAALKGRDGSTLLPQLRSAFSGEQLGFSYVAPEKRIPLLAHGYRLGMSVGVQPERAQTLMGDSDGGTPQRFVWLPATDSAVSADPPPEPLQMLVPMRGWRRGPGGFCTLHVPEVAVRTVRQAHATRMRGEGDALDGHALFVRLKVAQALALLDVRQHMDDEDWRLAGVVMQVSDATRTGVLATLTRQLRANDLARGKRDAVRAVTAADDAADHAAQRVARGIVARLGRAGGEQAWAALRKGTASRDRPHFEDAVECLISAGQAEVLSQGSTQRVRLVAQ